MCGLFGHTTRTRELDLAKSRDCLDSLAHRGPDQWGEWRDERVYLGHRRLSILDLSEAGRQPMVDGTPAIATTVNGEIYNYRELREQLRDQFSFSSDSDSEVVLHGYRAWGITGLLERLDGMFALVIYDAAAEKLHLARDPSGIKPLYYSDLGSEVAWASELKALRRYACRASIDSTALYDFLTYLYVPSPKTVYQGIYKLEPAHVLTADVRSGSLEIRRYWAPPMNSRRWSLDEAAEELRALLADSVRAQMVSDVPVGFFLSGGIDSGIVVHEAARSPGILSTYTIGFEDDPSSEVGIARQTAGAARTRHHEKILSASAAKGILPEMAGWYDEPFADMSAIPTYLVSQFARQTCTVALSGDGGDELFGGYRHYRKFNRFKHYRALAFLPVEARRLIREGASLAGTLELFESLDTRLVAGDLEQMTRLHGGLLQWEKRQWRERWGIASDYDDYWYFRKFDRPELPRRTRFQWVDFHTYLHDDILTKVDRASMAVSLEVRVPFLSRAMIELAFSLPEAHCYHAGRLKGIVKYAYRDRLPAGVLEQPKKGFGLPLKSWAGRLFAGKSRQESILEAFQLHTSETM